MNWETGAGPPRLESYTCGRATDWERVLPGAKSKTEAWFRAFGGNPPPGAAFAVLPPYRLSRL